MTEWAAGFPRSRWTEDGVEGGERFLAEECAVAIVHDASTTAVLMATPRDLEDLAVGFSLTEGVVDDVRQIKDVEVVETDLGFEARIWLTPDRSTQLAARRRRMAGPTGCGLCGIESLAEALHAPRKVEGRLSVAPRALLDAMALLPGAQSLGRETRAAHAAGFWVPGAGLVSVREDVGRHNALDKLAGTLALAGERREGVVLLTSRVSVEMVQKTAAIGAAILCAVSAPTALAVRTARAAGVTLAAVARSDGFEVFTYPERLLG
ncbi:formate dehydrogenase accessory sulfurtransferase FdhD [Caulobacter mirabilis]|uniref:Sulfur carrier protein FdhD n=1 Tax=Caulobacter mirabilis TaxID=69666 RepID=A0A2D2B2X4_9CAUL|nr:formate dehydrogenase accessory sulfurtransferase FdhD [Caulobacter mirabilis]ATQ44593.1 sulfurtransferase FdhD [Caulobacter mirabilis]